MYKLSKLGVLFPSLCMLEVILERIHIMTLKVVLQNITIFTHLADIIIHLKSCFWQSLGQVQKLSLLLALL